MKLESGKRLFVFLVVLFCSGTFLSAEKFEPESGIVENQLEREPSELREIEKDKTKIVFKTNVSGVEVFVNGTFYGRTKLEISDLLPGMYDVELRLAGYESENFSILVRKGFSLTYSLEMNLLRGTVSLFNLSDGCSVFIDGEKILDNYRCNKAEAVEKVMAACGEHTLLVQKFGCKDFIRNITVVSTADEAAGAADDASDAADEASDAADDANSAVDEAAGTVDDAAGAVDDANSADGQVQVELVPLDFDFSGFTVDKESFNPDRKGKKGTCNFDFEVTADGELTASVYNQKNELCWSCRLNNFSKKQQTFSWDGTENPDIQSEKKSKSKKVKAADGVYTVKLASEKKELTVQITVKR